MSRQRFTDMAEEWNLSLVATSEASPKDILKLFGREVPASGGWVLTQGEVSPHCADMDFEFPRTHALEMYGLLVSLGVALSQEAHRQLTSLCYCTGHVHPGAREAVVRVLLTVYAADAAGEYLPAEPQSTEQAA